METDQETGLPKLPEGLAWRVSRSSVSSNVKVSIVELPNAAPFYGDHYTYASASSESLKESTKRIYERVRGVQQQEVKAEELIGLYPPNSI
jgi:hypothetical protein